MKAMLGAFMMGIALVTSSGTTAAPVADQILDAPVADFFVEMVHPIRHRTSGVVCPVFIIGGFVRASAHVTDGPAGKKTIFVCVYLRHIVGVLNLRNLLTIFVRKDVGKDALERAFKAEQVELRHQYAWGSPTGGTPRTSPSSIAAEYHFSAPDQSGWIESVAGQKGPWIVTVRGDFPDSATIARAGYSPAIFRHDRGLAADVLSDLLSQIHQ